MAGAESFFVVQCLDELNQFSFIPLSEYLLWKGGSFGICFRKFLNVSNRTDFTVANLASIFDCLIFLIKKNSIQKLIF